MTSYGRLHLTHRIELLLLLLKANGGAASKFSPAGEVARINISRLTARLQWNFAGVYHFPENRSYVRNRPT